MPDPVWLIPVDAAPAQLRTTVGVLRRLDLPHSLIAPERVREELAMRPPPAAILQGGALSAAIVDAQRWLIDFRVPTLMLVERLTDRYEAALLDRGAQDVVGLPTSGRKLGSRLEALMRHQVSRALRVSLPESVMVADLVTISPRSRVVRVGEEVVALTKSEFDLLTALALRQGEVLGRSELAAALGRGPVTARALESHISRIRQKLGRAGAPNLLEAVRSVGYRLLSAPPPDQVTTPKGVAHPASLGRDRVSS